MDSSSDSDLEFIEQVINILPRPRFFRDRTNHFEMFDDIEFKLRFRLNKMTVANILQIIGEDLEKATLRNISITPLNQLLVTLRYFATGSFQSVLGDHINISQPSVSRIVTKVTSLIAALGPRLIQMPNNEEIQMVKTEFFEIARLPRVIGAIDCTHVKIQSPGTENAELFRNRKGWFSINVQAVCDANLKFLNIIARWPGSVHDSRIFYDSPLRVDLQDGRYGNCFLLGDAGYACKAFLLTPVNNVRTAGEQRYNEAHIRTRNCIERAFGIWKRRFSCLSVGMRLKMPTILNVIIATAVLHNIALLNQDPFINVEEEQPEELIDQPPLVNNNINNFFVRSNIINNYFN